MTQAILIYGNIADGCNFIGPFTDVSEACRFAELNKLDEWNAVQLAAPSEFKFECANFNVPAV